MHDDILSLVRVRVRDASPFIMGTSMLARVCCRRFGEGFVIREFVIFQFLCVPRGTAKSRQTVRTELARNSRETPLCARPSCPRRARRM